jgi:hypothetical protein
VATDLIPAALSVAAARLGDATHVAFEELVIPHQWPAGQFDLVVLSEIAYYFDQADLEVVLRRVLDSTDEGAHVVGVHWRGETDYPLSGDRAHAVIARTAGFVPLVHHLEADLVLDVWERGR